METAELTTLAKRLAQADRLWLFLDYDGTLAEFAPNPDIVRPEPQVIGLLQKLALHPRVRIAVVSGRRLSHIQQLLPVPELILAGTYGVEVQLPEEEPFPQVEFEATRPVLERLKSRLEGLISGYEGFYLEDKGWALALHARFADEGEARQVFAVAHEMMSEAIPYGDFRLLGGDRFMEFGPVLAHKGQTVAYLLSRLPWPGANLVYVGDDDKDEEAFQVIQDLGGIALRVSPSKVDSHADGFLENPDAVRAWLTEITSELYKEK
jgi:trehalose 6-phosphate phosphatase